MKIWWEVNYLLSLFVIKIIYLPICYLFPRLCSENKCNRWMQRITKICVCVRDSFNMYFLGELRPRTSFTMPGLSVARVISKCAALAERTSPAPSFYRLTSLAVIFMLFNTPFAPGSPSSVPSYLRRENGGYFADSTISVIPYYQIQTYFLSARVDKIK